MGGVLQLQFVEIRGYFTGEQRVQVEAAIIIEIRPKCFEVYSVVVVRSAQLQLGGEDLRAEEVAVDVLLEEPEVEHIAESRAGTKRVELGDARSIGQHAVVVRPLRDVGSALSPLGNQGAVLGDAGTVDVGKHVVELVLEHHNVGQHLAHFVRVPALKLVWVFAELRFAVLQGPFDLLVDIARVSDPVRPALADDRPHTYL